MNYNLRPIADYEPQQPGDGAAQALSPVVPAPSENVGLTGPISALPGNNPVTGTPIKRSIKKARSRVERGRKF